MLMLIGARRSGKGTIARVLARLVGADNVAGPRLSSLGGDFGLQQLIGKVLGIIDDARVSYKGDPSAIVESLLAIRGGGRMSINRKNRDYWTGVLRARIMLLTNELPKLVDQSGALAGSFLVLHLPTSYYGHEDTGLDGRLLAEIPSIFLWAGDGAARLRARGKFQPTAQLSEVEDAFESMSQPVANFVADRCRLGKGEHADKMRVYEEFKSYVASKGYGFAPNYDVFCRDLLAVVPGLSTTRPRTESGVRPRIWHGLSLNEMF